MYIDSTGGLLFASYYVVISLYSIWYYRAALLTRDVQGVQRWACCCR